MAAMLSRARYITKTVDNAAVFTLPPDCGTISGSELLCCPVAILGHELYMDNTIAVYALVIKQLWRIATDGKFAERLKDLAVFPDDADRPLAAHRVALLLEPLEELERSGCAPGREYHLGRDIGMIASSLNLVQIRINKSPASCVL